MAFDWLVRNVNQSVLCYYLKSVAVRYLKFIYKKDRRMSAEQTEDLKAFERRLTEVIDKLQPTARIWRLLLILVSVLTAVGAWTWLWDPQTTQVPLSHSLLNHPFFAISCIVLIILFLFGIHKRVVAPSIIASRCRQVLADYNMSCDDTGKLILKPRPTRYK